MKHRMHILQVEHQSTTSPPTNVTVKEKNTAVDTAAMSDIYYAKNTLNLSHTDIGKCSNRIYSD